jgi:hypothetical protein
VLVVKKMMAGFGAGIGIDPKGVFEESGETVNDLLVLEILA